MSNDTMICMEKMKTVRCMNSYMTEGVFLLYQLYPEGHQRMRSNLKQTTNRIVNRIFELDTYDWGPIG